MKGRSVGSQLRPTKRGKHNELAQQIIRRTLLCVSLLLAQGAEPAWASAWSLGIGSSSEYAMISTIVDDEVREFSLIRPLGLALDVRYGGFAEKYATFLTVQGQVPNSFSRLESRKLLLGLQYNLRSGAAAVESGNLPVTPLTSHRLYPYLRAGLVYQNFFYATRDLDLLLVIIDRSAAGVSFGAGLDWGASWLNPGVPEWRTLQKSLRVFTAEFTSTYTFISPDEESVDILSLSLSIRYHETL